MTHQSTAAMAKLNPQQQFMVAPPGLHEVAEVIRLQEPPGIFQTQAEMMQNQNFIIDPNVIQQHHQQQTEASIMTQMKLLQSTGFKDGLAYGLTKGQNAVNQMIQQNTNNINVSTCTALQQQQHQAMMTNNLCMPSSSTSNKQKNNSRKQKSSTFTDSQTINSGQESRGIGVGEDEANVHIKSSLDKVKR